MGVPIRLRGPNGLARLDADQDTQLAQLVDLIKEKSGVKTFSLKYGWPLADLDLSPASLHRTVEELKLRGETIVVVPLENTNDTSTVASSQPSASDSAAAEAQELFQPKPMEPDETVISWPERGGYVGMHLYYLLPPIPPSSPPLPLISSA